MKNIFLSLIFLLLLSSCDETVVFNRNYGIVTKIEQNISGPGHHKYIVTCKGMITIKEPCETFSFFTNETYNIGDTVYIR